MYNVIDGYKSRPPSQISPSPGTIVERKETNTEQSSADIRDPQLRVKRSSQRSRSSQRTASAYKVVGTELTVSRNPSLLLASELTDCLAQRFLNRALCLALIVSGDSIDFLELPRMWRPELASVRNRVANYTGRLFYNTPRSIDRTSSTGILSISLLGSTLE